MLSVCLMVASQLTHPSYIEGIVRGYRNGLLTGANYSNLVQCETIDGGRFSSRIIIGRC